MMKNGSCPKCGSTDIIADLQIHGSEGHPPFVSTHEPEPAKRPFVWMPKNVQSFFRAYICGACGYTEFYAENHGALNEGHKKGYRSS